MLMIRPTLGAVTALALAASAGADVVTDWNLAALNAIRSTSTPPPFASRALALTHSAVYDSVISIAGGRLPYARTQAVIPTASKEAAAATAAHTVLTALFPSQAATLNMQLSDHLGMIPDGADKTAGIDLGTSIATLALADRASDGSSAPSTWNHTGNYEQTPPGFGGPRFQQFRNVTPWTMTSGSQFRQGPPPAFGTPEFVAAYNEVKDLGSATSVTRTAEQTDIARLWAAGGGTATPPGQWNLIANQLAVGQSLPIEESARLFAMLNLATADAAIVAWDMKTEYDYCRPVTAIRAGDFDGDPATISDPTWTPLLTTPEFQAYTSGHSTFSGAAAAVLGNFFGTDSMNFSLTGDDVAITRNFTSFSEAAAEAGQSRIYGGIHWQFDNTVGLFSGDLLGDYIGANFLQVPAPSGVLALGVLGLAGIRRRRA